jgi:hypothetical protein
MTQKRHSADPIPQVSEVPTHRTTPWALLLLHLRQATQLPLTIMFFMRSVGAETEE